MAILWGSDHKRHRGRKKETPICHGPFVASLPKARQRKALTQAVRRHRSLKLNST